MTRRRLPSAAVALLLMAGVAGCGSDGGSGKEGTPTTAAPTSTSAPVDEATTAAYADRGPHEVGSRVIALDDGRRTVVWYPAEADQADQPIDVFDIASLLSPELQSQIPAELRPQYEIDARTGAEPADDGPFPVVLFSHGYAGFPEQSADLTTHLASWGFVVVAPEHVERSLAGLLGTSAQGVTKREDPEVLAAALDAAAADAERADSPLAGLLDLDRVAVTGHSAGAGAAYRLAGSDDRIRAFVAYSVGVGRRDGDAAAPPPVPEVPGMVMLGAADEVIPAEATRTLYEGMDAPKYLVEIADAGHLVFSDICLIGRDQGGLVALVAEAGLDLPEQLLVLASDGCEEDALDPTRAFAAIDHLSVAFLRHELGIDPEPVGLDPAVTAAFTEAEVALTSET